MPKGWEKQELGDIAEKIMVGIASAATHAYRNSGIRLLRNLNIKDGWIDDSDILYIDPKYEKQHKNKRLKEGDILTVRTGYPGLSSVVPGKYQNAQCFTSLITRLNTSKALPSYICTYINSPYGRKFITSGEAGGAQKNVNARMLAKMPILLPPIIEQEKIANILSTWDNAIQITNKLIESSYTQKKALMQQLLTGKKRLPGFKEKWKQFAFSEILTIKIGGTPSRNNPQFWDTDKITNNRWLSIRDLNKNIILDSKEYLSNEGVNNCNASLVPAGSIVMSFKLTIGKVAVLKNACYTNEAICALLPKKNSVISKEFLFHALGIINFEQEVDQAVKGKTLNKSKIERLIINLPPIEEQRSIADVLNVSQHAIDIYVQQLELLKKEKKALMQQLLTGRISVNAKRK